MKISSNLKKSDDEMWIVIRQLDILGKNTNPWNQESQNLDMIFLRNHRMNRREISEK